MSGWAGETAEGEGGVAVEGCGWGFEEVEVEGLPGAAEFEIIQGGREAVVVGCGEKGDTVFRRHVREGGFPFNHQPDEKGEVDTLPAFVSQAVDPPAADVLAVGKHEVKAVFMSQGTVHPGFLDLLGE